MLEELAHERQEHRKSLLPDSFRRGKRTQEKATGGADMLSGKKRLKMLSPAGVTTPQ